MSALDSTRLKAAVMSYFRFERGGVAATEVTYSEVGGMADVLVDTEDEIIEIETKIDKVDLEVHELSKPKHEVMRYRAVGNEDKIPNRYYICVPQNLHHAAVQFIEDVNSDYGLILFDTRVKRIDSRTVKIVKPAKKLHEQYNPQMKKAIILRLCSEIANMYEKKANSEWDESGGTRKVKHKRENVKERRPSGRVTSKYSEDEYL